MVTSSERINSAGTISEDLARRRRLRPQPQFAIDWQATHWRDAANRLGEWAQQHLVNRSDVHGSYLPLDARKSSDDKATTKYEGVTSELLTRHFIGADHGHLVGLHTTSADNTSRWMAIDIDSHGGNSKKATWSVAHSLFERLGHLGLQVLLFDSDGRSGFHLLIVFEAPIATKRLFDFGRWLLRDTSLPCLPSPPELFPKQRELKPDQFGNWLRLPGRHHTLDHWTRVWNGSRWLAGNQAIQLILDAGLNSEDQVPDLLGIEKEDKPSSNWTLRQVDSKYSLAHPLNKVLSRVRGATESGDQWTARCPAHHDHTPSLSISVGDRGKVLVHCHTGCDTEDVLDAIELSFEDLWAEQSMVGRGKRHITKTVEPPVDESLAVSTVEWTKLSKQFEAAISADRLQALADELRVSSQSLSDVYLGWDERSRCFTIPERDAALNIIGISRRYCDGSKRCMAGSKRGLCVPVGFDERQGPILVVEGASDVAASLTHGFCAVGRPCAAGGGNLLVELLNDDVREVIVVGEFDPKPDGSWPGLDGAKRVAQQLAEGLRREISTVFPPDNHKDVRDWLAQLVSN